LTRMFVVAFLLAVGLVTNGVAQGEILEGHSWDGSRAPAVHRLPLVARDGQEIEPENGHAMPFSVRNTCGSCHDYAAISGGFHFNSASDNSSETRAGEPWVLVDTGSGTQLPISYRSRPGTWKPDDLGLTPWRFTQLFARHMPGGDMAEPEDEFGDPSARWNITGGLEVNCLGCHNGAPHQNQSEWAIQVARENFAWAGVAASGLGEVGGTTTRLPDTWTIYDGPNPDDKLWAVPPSVDYDTKQFDGKGRAFFEVDSTPPDERCLHCHSTSKVDTAKWTVDPDVHAAAGLQCVSCHRNGIDHNIVRGYENEAAERGNPVVAEFSCRGCHLGDLDQQHGFATGGRMGAPRPEHKGLPPVHLEGLSCTACHSGPRPEDAPARVRTSRANRLGIHGKAQWYTEAPYIAEPVFVRGEGGKIEPRRMMWPAFWARVEGDDVTPLLPDEVAPTLHGILNAEQQVGSILISISNGLAAISNGLAAAEDGLGEAVFVAPGKVYHLNVDGGLDVSDYNGAMPITGPGWARYVDGEVMQLVPDFDPTVPLEEFDPVVDNRLTSILKALEPDKTAPVRPVLCFGDKVFTVSPDDWLETSEQPGDAAGEMAWGWMEDGAISPIVPEFVVRAVQETAGADESFTEEQVAMALGAMTDAETERTGGPAEFSYISGGKMFRLNDADQLVASGHPAAEPYSWPMAHDVRPATQSLGAKSCTECHAKGTPFYFGHVRAFGPLKTDSVAVTPVRELHGERGPVYVRINRFFKWLIIVTMTLLVLHILADLMRRALRKRAG
jgi:hypothetical protein